MTESSIHDFDIVINGGGLTGASAALALSNRGWRVALIEPSPPPTGQTVRSPHDWDTRIFAINPTNQAFLQQMGVWPADRRINPVKGMDITGDTHGYIAFSAEDATIDTLAWIVENRSLVSALWKRLSDLGITLFTSTSPIQLIRDEHHAILTLSTHQQLRCQLVIGADGGHSWVREHSHIPYRIHDYQQSAVVANFSCEKPHHHIARQWFLGNGVLAWLPLPGKRISMVWSSASPKLLLDLDSKALAHYVAQTGKMTLGELKTITPASAFPLCMISPQSIVANRVLLMGDAAHLIHPLAGQGINLGFSDVQVLAQQLTPTTDPGEATALRHFAHSRLIPVKTMQYTCHVLFSLFHATYLPALPWIRNTALSWVNRLAPLRRQLIRYATGL